MIGIDEVGRGAWAGPLLVVAARELGLLPPGLADSKTLSKSKRKKFITGIKNACQLGHGWVYPSEIDNIGLTAAMKLGVSRALRDIEATHDEEIIMDGAINYCDDSFVNVTCVIKADAMYPLVSAASIYAKVTRDAEMAAQAIQFPYHGFASHVGYGTKVHAAALKNYGVTNIHRLSYKPVRSYL